MIDNSKIKKTARIQLKGRWAIPLAAALASGAVTFLFTTLENNLPDETKIKFIFNIFKYACTAIFSFAVCKICYDLTTKSEPLSFSDYTDSFTMWFKAILIRFWSYLWIGIWCLLIIIPSIFIFILGSGMAIMKHFDMTTMNFKEGFSLENIENSSGTGEFLKIMFTEYLGLGILLIVILIAVFAMYLYKSFQYGQMRYIVIENKNISIRKSMKISIEYMKGHVGDLFKLVLSFIGWIILCLSPSFFKDSLGKIIDPKFASLIISLLTTITTAILNPYMVTSRANFYKIVKEEALLKGKVKQEDFE